TCHCVSDLLLGLRSAAGVATAMRMRVLFRTVAAMRLYKVRLPGWRRRNRSCAPPGRVRRSGTSPTTARVLLPTLGALPVFGLLQEVVARRDPWRAARSHHEREEEAQRGRDMPRRRAGVG